MCTYRCEIEHVSSRHGISPWARAVLEGALGVERALWAIFALRTGVPRAACTMHSMHQQGARTDVVNFEFAASFGHA